MTSTGLDRSMNTETLFQALKRSFYEPWRCKVGGIYQLEGKDGFLYIDGAGAICIVPRSTTGNMLDKKPDDFYLEFKLDVDMKHLTVWKRTVSELMEMMYAKTILDYGKKYRIRVGNGRVSKKTKPALIDMETRASDQTIYFDSKDKSGKVYRQQKQLSYNTWYRLSPCGRGLNCIKM